MANSLQRLRGLTRPFPLTEWPFQTRLPFLTLYRHTGETVEIRTWGVPTFTSSWTAPSGSTPLPVC